MDYKELSRVIRELSEIYGLADEVASQLMLAASTSITDLLARAEAAEARAEKAERDIERLKKIMRDEGIVVISSKYPGCKSEWNLSRRGKEK